MKFRTILFGAALAAGTQANAQTWVEDTISTEANYLKNVYYSLEKGQTAKVDADNWHIGFSAGTYSASIITNSADQGVKLYEISKNLNDFGTDMRAALNNAMNTATASYYNSNLSWEVGAFNQPPAAHSFDYGWCEYDMTSHWLIGNRIFGLISGTDTFQIQIVDKQTFQVTGAPIYNFKIANIDGSNPVSENITLGVAPYNDRYFVYYNITTGTFINREPARTDWDFVFSSYNDENVGNYKVFGIINNEGLKVARVDTADTEFDNIASNYAQYTYDTVNNSIGRAWKVAGMSGTSVVDSLCYFVETRSGDIWQLVFTAHNSGLAPADPGLVALKKRKLFDNTTKVRTVQNNDVALFQAYPNPAATDVNVLIDAKTRMENAQLMITDMTGKTVYRGKVNVNTGLNAIHVSTAGFANGNYILTLTNGKWNATQKLVVQH